MTGDILYSTFYLLLFSFIILKSIFFRLEGFKNIHSLGAFYLKLLFGIGLWYIYTRIYKNRFTSDIFKYYDDAGMMYATIHHNWGDFFRMLTGIGDSNIHYQAIYHSMSSWDNAYNTTLYNNSHFIIRLNALLMLISRQHYAVHVIIFCFIAFTGLVLLYKVFYPFLANRKKGLFAALFLFPSVILWSSGVLKEGLVWLGLGMSIFFFFQLLEKRGSWTKNLCLIIIGFFLTIQVKEYVLLCLLPGFIVVFLIRKSSFCRNHKALTSIGVFILYFMPLGFSQFSFSGINPLRMLADKQQDFNRVTKGGIYLENMKDSAMFAIIPVTDSSNIVPLTHRSDSLLKKGIVYISSNPVVYKEWTTHTKAPFMLKKGSPFVLVKVNTKDTLHLIASDSTAYWVYIYVETANSRISIDPIKPTLSSLIAHIPQALSISFIRPYPNEIHSAMTLFYAFENLFILVLIILSLFFLKRKIEHPEMVMWCISYCFIMLVLIGLVTPIYGAIERYKSLVIPFIFIGLLMITDKDKIRSTFKDRLVSK